MAYKSKSRKIRDALIGILNAVSYDAGGGAEPAFALVTGDPSTEFAQEPYALVYPAPTLDSKGATGQNDREVQFEILLLLSMQNGQRTQSQTYNYMYDLSELVLDALDEGDFTDALDTQDASIGAYLMDAKRSSFIPADVKGGAVLLCTIDVSISYAKNL